MAVLMTADLPISLDDATALSTAMDAFDNPPTGLIVHLTTKTPDGVRIVDIWESQEDIQKFSDEVLLPTMRRVFDERGISLEGPPPEPTFEEGFDLVRGR